MTTPLSPKKRVDLTRAVLDMLEDWEVPAEQRTALLGLPDSTKARELNRYRLSGALPEQADVYQRVELLLEIDSALHQFLPHNPSAGRLWITTPRPRFGGVTPLAIMLEKGVDGMRVLADLLSNRPSF